MEGKGNGIKTVIVNMVDVARALLRPPTYVTKYFGCELGAQTQFDIKVIKSDETRQRNQSKRKSLKTDLRDFVLKGLCNRQTSIVTDTLGSWIDEFLYKRTDRDMSF